ncbi:unnamed protein product [Linum tenue]|uniref:Methyltransferase small domain-containing protein n=1 Tax=Linum tenue TaxID=586396 RepID=A0AAV0NH26_9ROSI|nr:unnamed protein product [Linum tenue]
MHLYLLSSRVSFSPPVFWHASSSATLPFPAPATAKPLPPPSSRPAKSLKLEAAIPPSNSKCALECPHFQSCSGCTHELDLDRPSVVDEAAEFFSKLGVSDFTFDSSRLWEWRCRAKLAVRGSSATPLIGLYEEGTHNVVDIPHCKAHHPRINAAVELLRKGITALRILPYDEDQGTGDLRYVQMAVTTHNTSLPVSDRYKNGKVQVSLVWNTRNETSPSSEKLTALAQFLWRNGGPKSNENIIHSVWANFQTSSNNIIFGNRWRHLLGETDLWEHVGGIDVSLAPSSFGQANTRAFDSLLWKLQKYVPRRSSVADLYAGAGVIGLSVAASRKCRSVKCVEVNKESKLSFEKTVERLPKSLDGSISWHQADTSAEPLSWLMGSEVVIVDPPRKGLDAPLVDALKTISFRNLKPMPSTDGSQVKEEKRPWVLRARESSVYVRSSTTSDGPLVLPQTLIYISCGWESFKEDCKALLSTNKWRLEHAHGFNFFPGTQSIEVLAVFQRGKVANLKKKKLGKKKKRS